MAIWRPLRAHQSVDRGLDHRRETIGEKKCLQYVLINLTSIREVNQVFYSTARTFSGGYVDVGDAWAKLLLQLSAEPRAGAGLGKEQRPAKNHENKLILILFLMYV